LLLFLFDELKSKAYFEGFILNCRVKLRVKTERLEKPTLCATSETVTSSFNKISAAFFSLVVLMNSSKDCPVIAFIFLYS
jgi:hypothetical protein